MKVGIRIILQKAHPGLSIFLKKGMPRVLSKKQFWMRSIYFRGIKHAAAED